jgi:hypothetical protein
MLRAVKIAALALFLAAVVLPPQFTAGWLVGSGSARLAEVAGGVWMLKGAMVLCGALLLAGLRWVPRTGTFEALVPRGVIEPRAGGASAKWGIGGLIALATVLRLHALEVGPWFDEIDTWLHYGRRPLGEIVSTFDSQNQHLLYSVLARLSIVTLGDGVFALRLPAAILGVACVPALWLFARRVATGREALFAATLLTVSYHHVWFSQNARGYTGLLLFTLLGSTAFLHLLSRREPEGVAAPLLYGLSMALAVAVHATAVLAVAAHGLIWLGLLLTSRGRRVGLNRWAPGWGFLFATGFSLLLYALVLPQFVETLLAPTMPGAETEWKNPWWLVTEAVTVLSAGLPGGQGGQLLLALGLLVGGLGAASYGRQGWAILATLVLGAVLTGGAMVATGHNLWPRLFFFSAGFFVLIAIRGFAAWVALTARAGLERMAGGLLTALLTLVCLTSASMLPTVYAPKQDFLGALEWVEAEKRPGDAVVAVDMAVMPLRELYGAGCQTADNLPGLQAIERIHDRTWLVYTTPTRLKGALPDLWEHLEAEYEESQTFWGTVSGGEVVVMIRPRPPE